MRVAVLGTGGVGGYFGGRLAQGGEVVTFIARGEHLRAIQTSGLRVDSLNGDFVVNPAKATDDVSDRRNRKRLSIMLELKRRSLRTFT